MNNWKHYHFILLWFVSCLELLWEMEDQEDGQQQQVNSEMEEVLLLCRKIKIQQRLFCFEFKENCFAQYLLISHNGSSLLVPSNGISCFLDAVDCLSSGFVKQEQRDYDGFSKEKELKIEDKVWPLFLTKKKNNDVLNKD